MQPPGEPARNNKSSSSAAAAAFSAAAAPAAPKPAAAAAHKNNAGSSGGQSGPIGDDQELTEEELRFMAEQMGDDASECESGAMFGQDGSDVGLISDVGSDMPDEVEAAFQQFLDEQIQQQQNGTA